ncbi:hypothetical protein TNIN_297551 [Trichonephila inaurata madagascariensis]|uniref:Uncharacterized protein n=1 Tax=Trichonephila inaurata madagascariensis TaxID=2747483 RepID=A0A8X7BWK1_9ARAC|nr:hypothetical protein TNIN_297551 [Trichonephila inaurata madagascariensis]
MPLTQHSVLPPGHCTRLQHRTEFTAHAPKIGPVTVFAPDAGHSLSLGHWTCPRNIGQNSTFQTLDKPLTPERVLPLRHWTCLLRRTYFCLPDTVHTPEEEHSSVSEALDIPLTQDKILPPGHGTCH